MMCSNLQNHTFLSNKQPAASHGLSHTSSTLTSASRAVQIHLAAYADGKVCVVTGASRGIGKSIALKLGSEGAKVVVNYASSADAAEEVAAAIKASGGDAMTVKCNTGSQEEITAMFKTVMDEWGTVDVLVNNAGVIILPSVYMTNTMLHSIPQLQPQRKQVYAHLKFSVTY